MMRVRAATLAATMAATMLASTALWAPPAQATELRAEVGKPLAKAKSLLAARRFPEAMAQVRAASAVRGLSPEENFVIDQMKAAIAQTSGDTATAARTFADMLASGKVPASEVPKLLTAEAGIAYTDKNYPVAISWLQKYFKAGGSAPEMRTLLIQSYYLSGDFVNAAHLQSQVIAATVKSGQRPTEQQLQLLARCQQESKDLAGFQNTMTQLVYYYPKPDYWQNLIHNVQVKPGFSDRLTLDLDRFEMMQGMITKPADYMEMTELALQVPLPGEAKAILDKGYAANVLGTGPEAARTQRLRDLVAKTYASEQPKLAAREADAKDSHDGNLLVALGEEYASYGQFDKGIPLMEAGLKKDQLRHADDSKLHLGLAYMQSGNKARALAVLKTVGGTEGAGDLAKLWVLYINTKH